VGERGFTRTESGWLRSEESDACAYTEPDWKQINSTWRGRIDVSATGYDDELCLEVMLRRNAPTEPTVAYHVRGGRFARVDVNGGHEGGRFTHLQYRTTPDAKEITLKTPEWFVEVPLGPDIEDGLLIRALQDATKWLRVDTAAVDWTLPSWREL
jgi:hypothetical protein